MGIRTISQILMNIALNTFINTGSNNVTFTYYVAHIWYRNYISSMSGYMALAGLALTTLFLRIFLISFPKENQQAIK